MSTQTPDRNDGDEDLSVIEPDIQLIVNYLNRELPPDQMEVVDMRLVTDEAFFELAVPLMQIRHTRLNLTEKYGAVTGSRGRVSAATASSAVQATGAPGATRGRTRQAMRWVKRNYLITGMAAAIVLALALPALPSIERSIGISGQHDVYSGDVTTLAEARDFDLPNGGAVHLGPHSSVAYNAHITRHRLMVWLTGQATITVPKGDDSIMVIRNSGFVSLAADGQYSLNAVADDSLIHVAVIRGGATMTSFSQATASITLTAGQTGVMSNIPRFTGYTRDRSTGASAGPTGSRLVDGPVGGSTPLTAVRCCDIQPSAPPFNPPVLQDLLYRVPRGRPPYPGRAL
jgi:hypothetical protein